MVSLAVESAREHDYRPEVLSSARRDYLIGIALLLAVVLLWTLSSFITQAIFEGGYNKPFLVTYFNTSAFTIYLLPFLIRHILRKEHDEDISLQEIRAHYETLPTSEHDTPEDPPLNSSRVPYLPATVPHSEGPESPESLAPLTSRETAHLASIFCILWFIANWSINASLDYTSVTSATILASTSGFFTLVVGRIFGVESLTPAKIAAVVASFLGVLLVSLSDSSPESGTTDPTAVPEHVYTNALLGDILALSTAVFYALYVILLKVRIRVESRIDMQLFFGFVGFFSILAILPVGVVLHFTGYETFQLPSSGRLWGAVLINMALTVASDYIYVIAMLRTTPVLVTIGLSLTIPFAAIGDSILNKPTTAQAGLGALLVFAGFGLAGWDNSSTRMQKPVDQLDDEHTSVEMFRRLSPDAIEASEREVVV